MPETGEIRKGSELGKTSRTNYIWQACSKCGVTRWVRYFKKAQRPASVYCHDCSAHMSNSAHLKPYNDDAPPVSGEVRTGDACGRYHHHHYMWVICPMCGKGFWKRVVRDGEGWRIYKSGPYCHACAMHTKIKEKPLNVAEPYLGETRMGWEIGSKVPKQRHIYLECPECHVRHWVIYRKDAPGYQYVTCKTCTLKKGKALFTQRGKNHPGWHGGRIIKNGYVQVWVEPGSFFYSMVGTHGYVLEHRLVMAQHLGRCLQPFEAVHHKNGKRDDNRIENLELTQVGAHITAHHKGYKDGYTKGLADGRNKQIEELKEQIGELQKQIKLLQWQQKEIDKI